MNVLLCHHNFGYLRSFFRSLWSGRSTSCNPLPFFTFRCIFGRRVPAQCCSTCSQLTHFYAATGWLVDVVELCQRQLCAHAVEHHVCLGIIHFDLCYFLHRSLLFVWSQSGIQRRLERCSGHIEYFKWFQPPSPITHDSKHISTSRRRHSPAHTS